MKSCVFWVSIILLSFCVTTRSFAADQAVILNINTAIGPATQSYIEHGIEYAAAQHANVVILRLDTPGGLETSMRGIDKAILESPIPVITFVAPAGARAASAGTFILYASHIAAMAPGTNVGAASPVNIGDESPNISQSPEKKKSDIMSMTTLERKAQNDAAAYIRSLAELRDRNATWAEQAVREAVSLSANEALKAKVIDVVANNVPDLLHQINGHPVKVKGTLQNLQTDNLTLNEYKQDWRYALLSAITDPNIAYILLLIGIYGLFFEFYNPGFVLPGVAGAICLLLALYAFQLLPINYVGFALLLLGITFMIIEVLISSFGILGIGGIIAFVTGSILLLDIQSPGYTIAWSLIVMMTIFSVMFFLIVIGMTVRAMRKKIVSGKEALIGTAGIVLDISLENGLLVKIQGETWKAHCASPLMQGQKIRVRKISGLVLTVEPDL